MKRFIVILTLIFLGASLPLHAAKKKQNACFTVNNRSVTEVVNKIVTSVEKPYKVKTYDAEAGTVLLHTGASLWSWGELYPITVQEISDKTCLVEVGFQRKDAIQITGKGLYKKCVKYLMQLLEVE